MCTRCVTLIGYDRPALKLLNKYVRSYVDVKWYDLGLKLLEQQDEERLNDIMRNNLNDPGASCKEMFQLWLRSCSNATWNQLIEALREVELSNLATEIEGMLIPTGPEVINDATPVASSSELTNTAGT